MIPKSNKKDVDCCMRPKYTENLNKLRVRLGASEDFSLGYALSAYYMGREDQKAANKKNIQRQRKKNFNKEVYDNYSGH